MDTKELEYPVLSTRMERFWFALLVLTFVLEGLWVLFIGIVVSRWIAVFIGLT